MKIRAEQMEKIQNRQDEALVKQIADHLHKNHPQNVENIEPELLHSLIREGIPRARQIGMTWESAITGFVTLIFVIARRFDEQPAIREVLTDETLPANARLNFLTARVKDDDWLDARRNYNDEPANIS